MNCQIPDARPVEYAIGLYALSIIGSKAVSRGMPRFSTSVTM